MVLHRCPLIRMTGLECTTVLWSTADGAYQLNPQQLLLAKALINFFTYPTDDESIYILQIQVKQSMVAFTQYILKIKQTFI